MDQKISKIQKKVQLELDESRYEHTQGVMYTAACLLYTSPSPRD